MAFAKTGLPRCCVFYNREGIKEDPVRRSNGFSGEVRRRQQVRQNENDGLNSTTYSARGYHSLSDEAPFVES
jgi:hypothetical protein